MDKKPTDSEIVKALDICSKSTNGCSHSNFTCEDCYLNGQPMCSSVLLQDTIDLINRLQAENESLIKLNKLESEIVADKGKEIERLNKEIKAVTECKFESVSQSAKAEAYQEFAERLKKKAHNCFMGKDKAVTVDNIDNLLNELAGDSSAKEKQ